MTDTIRVIIADDHTIVRSGVRMLLEAEPDIEVVGEALDGLQALRLAKEMRPDVVLMDVTMPGLDGLEATRRIKAEWPGINILVLTMHRSEEYFFEMLRAGASGYILKGAETGELINAVRIVARGQVYLYPTMAVKLVQDYLRRDNAESESGSTLSPREKEILELIAEGYSNKEIAEKLVVSPSTVHSHRSNLMMKLGLNSRRELIHYARESGLIQR